MIDHVVPLHKVKTNTVSPASSKPSYVSLISSIHKSYPVPQSAIFIPGVPTLDSNRRWPMHYNPGVDWLPGQQYRCNWIIWNRKHLFLASWHWTATGRLTLDSIKHTYWCYYGPSSLATGMSGSCASTQTIKATKISRWVRALHHKWVPRNLLWTTGSTSSRNYPGGRFLQLDIQWKPAKTSSRSGDLQVEKWTEKIDCWSYLRGWGHFVFWCMTSDQLWAPLPTILAQRSVPV